MTYIHKVKDGGDLCFFANFTDSPVDTQVALRGDKKLERWNPMTGDRQPCEASHSGEQPVTTFRLVMDLVTASFLVQTGMSF